MQKRILILNGSFCEVPIIQKAKELGYYVITTGNMPHLIGHQYADEYINADYSDKERILEIVKENHIDCIFSCANDFGVITASYVAENMGWPGHDTYENSILLHHKDKFKAYAYENNIPSPHSLVFTDINEAKAYVSNAKYPIIVKANDLTGGKGIMKAQNISEALSAIDNAFSRSRDKHLVLEPFIEGTQHTIIAFLVNKKVYISSSCNCYSPINPYLIQSEVLPADNFEIYQPKLHQIIEDMAEKLHLVDGIIALQYIVHDNEIYVIEAMRRCFGNQFLTLLTRLTGFPWEEAQLRAELGEPCALPISSTSTSYCGHHGIMATRNGIVKSYTIDPSIEKHIFKTFEILKPGALLTDYMNERIAYIFYEYEDRAEMLEAVKHFNENIKIEFEDN